MAASNAGTAIHQRNTDIEVLRAVAILFVLVLHYFWESLPEKGGFLEEFHSYFELWTGVDLFFCISGFVIATSLLEKIAEAPTGSNKLGILIPFYIRRCTRILPSAWLWISIPLILSFAYNQFGYFAPFKSMVGDAVAAFTHIFNFHAVDLIEAPKEIHHSLSIFWSLSLEEQFYFVFPFLLLFLPKRNYLWIILALGFVVQFGVPRPHSMAIGHGEGGEHPLWWYCRTDSIILGVALALLKEQVDFNKLLPDFLINRKGIHVFAFVLILLLALFPSELDMVSFSTGMVALVSAALVFLAAQDKNLILPASPMKNMLVWVGERSFSLYLVHGVVIAVLKETSDRFLGPHSAKMFGMGYAAAFLITAFCLSGLIAHLNFTYIETPLRRKGRKLADAYAERTLTVARG